MTPTRARRVLLTAGMDEAADLVERRLMDNPDEVLDRSQRTLEGDPEPQARLAGGEQGERGQGETLEAAEENPGGLMADRRDPDEVGGDKDDTEQQIPDEFNVAEGGQETL